MSAPNARLRQDVAVVDIGSNSVRLVVYRLEGRSIWAVYNEKVVAGLGRDLSRTGALSKDGVRTALAALRRFRAVIEGVKPASVFCAGTAAVRDATDGRAFARRVKAETGFNVDVLTGAAEARLAALGVIAGAPDAEGVAGDLGGASLELVRVGAGRVGRGVTLPLGALQLRSASGGDPEAARRTATEIVAKAAGRFGCESFHAVGGSWRNLALLQMRIAGYPLHIVHQYEISSAEALEAARFLARQSRASLEQIEGVPRRRLETLPFAAVAMEAVIEALGARRVVFSAFGLREGMLYDAMSRGLRRLDPLVEGCAAIADREAVGPDIGPALADWISPLFEALDPVLPAGRERTLRAATCRLAGVGARLHPDHRADLLFTQILRAPLTGLNHKERAFLAVSVFSRHTAASPSLELTTLNRLLSPSELRRARAVGAAVRLGCDLSARTPALLRKATVRLAGGALHVRTAARDADMLLGEQTAKRASTLGDLLGLKVKLSA